MNCVLCLRFIFPKLKLEGEGGGVKRKFGGGKWYLGKVSWGKGEEVFLWGILFLGEDRMKKVKLYH